MPPKKAPLIWMLGFISLNLYVNVLPKLFPFQTLDWFLYWLGFFLLAYLLARYVLQLQGLQSYGLSHHKGWSWNLGLGFLLGFSIWALKYGLFYGLGKFGVAGVMDSTFILALLAQALLAMGFASALNDVMIRGYWLACFRQQPLGKGYLCLVTLLYVLDDGWNEGLDGINIVFSSLVGLALAYTVIKTKSIWMSIGIHWGSNLTYRLLYGFTGQGIWKLEQVKENSQYEYISLLVTALLLPLVYLLLKGWPWKGQQKLANQFPFPARLSR